MPCLVFKWGAGWRKGICYSGVSWVLGGENTACCVFILSVLLLLLSSPFALLLNCFYHNPRVLPFRSDSPHHPIGVGEGERRSERATAWFFVADWGQTTSVPQYKKDIKLLECVQRRVTKMMKGLKGKAYKDCLRSLTLFRLEKAEGWPHHSLQLPQGGQQKGSGWSPLSGDQWQDTKTWNEAASGEVQSGN